MANQIDTAVAEVETLLTERAEAKTLYEAKEQALSQTLTDGKKKIQLVKDLYLRIWMDGVIYLCHPSISYPLGIPLEKSDLQAMFDKLSALGFTKTPEIVEPK